MDDHGYFAAPAQHQAAAAEPTPRPGFVPPAALRSAGPPTNPPRVGRFAKTDVSFGLTGRVVLTVLLLLPLAWFCYLAVHYFIGIGGIVLYGGVVVPWALRDLWRAPSRR